LELIGQQVSKWRNDAGGASIELPDLQGRDRAEPLNRFLARVSSLALRAEQDNDPQRLEHFESATAASLNEIQREWLADQPDAQAICDAVITAIDREKNPFIAAHMVHEFNSRVCGALAEADPHFNSCVLEARATGDRYLVQRNRAQDLDSLRSADNLSPAPAPEDSAPRVHLGYFLKSAIIAAGLDYVFYLFIGGDWVSVSLIWLFLAGLLFLIQFLRRGGQLNVSQEEDESAAEQPNLLPAEFKRELRADAKARLNRFFAQSELERLTNLQQTWQRSVEEHECGDLQERLEQLCTWIDGQLSGAPDGFLNEILPGEILLYGRALSQLIIRNLFADATRERKQDSLAYALHPSDSVPWRERLAHSSSAGVGEALARAATDVVGELSFSTIMQQILRDPEGEVAAKTWLDRLLKEVMAASPLIEGVTSQTSDVREVLNCGLPGGRSDPLATYMAQQFNCEVFQSTIANGLELVCITRNVELDELASTRHLEDAYLKFDPKVREIYFEFPSRGRIADTLHKHRTNRSTENERPVSL